MKYLAMLHGGILVLFVTYVKVASGKLISNVVGILALLKSKAYSQRSLDTDQGRAT